MDYLRTLGSAAVSTLVQKSGLNLPFTLGAKVTSFESVWSLYDGTKRDDGSAVSIFEYTNRATMQFARNAVRKLRTIRHPDVLKFMDAVETDTVIFIMTERVRSLTSVLPTWTSRDVKEREDWLLWGLHRISVALAFVNDSCVSTHGNLRVNSCFISPSGEWKLGGFELLSSPKDDAAVLYSMGSLIPEASVWVSPETRKAGYSTLKNQDPAAADAYALGLLFHAVFNPNQGPPVTAQPPHTAPLPSSRGSIPISVFPSFKKLLNPNPKARISPKLFLAIGMAEHPGEGSGFFTNNKLVKICLGLDNFSLGSDAEKAAFLRTLKESSSTFPSEFASHRVLPSLITALEYGGASAAIILPLLLQLGKNVAQDEYSLVVLAPLIKLFANPDRGTRMALLDHLSEYADRLDKKAVSDKIWPHLQTGFSDTVAVIREVTVKSIILLSPHFTERILNNDLLRYLAKMQSDPENSIRTNTCILIGRLGPSLGYNTKRKVLVSAFTRALKDTFVHARVAGLMAFMATIDCFDPEDLATKVIPNIAPSLMDSEKLVRDQAFKAVELFVKRLESHVATMSETLVPEGVSFPGNLASTLPTQSTLVNSAAGAAGALAGWAISSLGRKLAAADLQSVMTSAPVPQISTLSSSAPELGNEKSFPGAFVQATSFGVKTTPNTSSASGPSASTVKGMQLGKKQTSAATSVALAMELTNEAAAEEADNPWRTDDLIDINADQDDWSAFETAPVAGSQHEMVVSLDYDEKGVENQDVLSTHAQVSDTGHSNGLQTLNPWILNSQNTATPPWNGFLSFEETNRGDNPRGAYIQRPKSTQPVEALSTFNALPPTIIASQSIPVVPQPTTTMTKEEKSAEMARRKEERKQRIAQLKEQKKIANASRR